MWPGGGTISFLIYVVLLTPVILQVKGDDEVWFKIINLESDKRAPVFLRENAMIWYNKAQAYDALERKPYYIKGMTNPSTVGVYEEELSEKDGKYLSDSFRKDLESFFRKAQVYDYYTLEESRYKDVYWKMFELSFGMDGDLYEDYKDDVQEWYDKAQLYDQSEEKNFYYKGMEDPSSVGVSDEELDWDIGLSDSMMEIIENWFIKAQLYDFQKLEAKNFKGSSPSLDISFLGSPSDITLLELEEMRSYLPNDIEQHLTDWFISAQKYDELKWKPFYYKGMDHPETVGVKMKLNLKDYDLSANSKDQLETLFVKAQMYEFRKSEYNNYKGIKEKISELHEDGKLKHLDLVTVKEWYESAQMFDKLENDDKPFYKKGMNNPYKIGVSREKLCSDGCENLPKAYIKSLHRWFIKAQMYQLLKPKTSTEESKSSTEESKSSTKESTASQKYNYNKYKKYSAGNSGLGYGSGYGSCATLEYGGSFCECVSTDMKEYLKTMSELALVYSFMDWKHPKYKEEKDAPIYQTEDNQLKRCLTRGFYEQYKDWNRRVQLYYTIRPYSTPWRVYSADKYY